MRVQSTSIAFLLVAVALGAGVLERDRIWPKSTVVASRQAVKPPPLPPTRPEVEAAHAQTFVAAAPAVPSPPVALPTPPMPPAALTPPAPPPRMTLAQQAGFDAWIVKTYLGCWKPAAPAADFDPYVARVRLAFKPDGSLMKPPKLVNPPSDPASKPQAKSVMQAVQSCNPLAVPAQYRPFYEQWKTKTIHFDPQIAAR